MPKNTWNPWSYDILDHIGFNIDDRSLNPYSCDCINNNVDSNCGHVSLLDKKLINHFGQDYLLRFTTQCYSKYITKLRTDVLTHDMGKLCVEGGEDDGKQMSSTRIHKFMKAIEFRTDIVFMKGMIPCLPLPVGTNFHLRIATFQQMDVLYGYPMDEPFFTYRRRLCALLEEYCENSASPELKPKLKFVPAPGNLCIVKVRKWSEIDQMMREEKGKSWKARLHRRTNEDDDEWMAGKWFRAIMIERCNLAPRICPIAYEVFLVDVGRFVAVHKNDIHHAVMKFLTIPAMAVKGTLLLQSLLLNEPQLRPEDLREKWYSLFERGTVFPCRMLCHSCDESIVVTMPYDIEQKFDDIFEKKYTAKFEQALEAVKEQKEQPKINEEYILSFSDLNFACNLK